MGQWDRAVYKAFGVYLSPFFVSFPDQELSTELHECSRTFCELPAYIQQKSVLARILSEYWSLDWKWWAVNVSNSVFCTQLDSWWVHIMHWMLGWHGRVHYHDTWVPPLDRSIINITYTLPSQKKCLKSVCLPVSSEDLIKFDIPYRKASMSLFLCNF